MISSVLRVRRGRGPALLLVAAALAGCSPEPSAPRQTVPAVGVYTVAPQSYTVTETLPGRARAYMSSEVRPQVDGIIEKRLFKEGSDVAAGQILYRIDAARYAAARDAARARLQEAEAAVKSARPLAQRSQKLARMNALSQQERDNAVADLAQKKAAVATARADLESARIDLEYTRIKAPIDGRIGASTYTPGALVTANQSQPLATINQLDPIYVDIRQSVGAYLRLERAVDSGRLNTDADNAAPVRVTPEGGHRTLDGRLEFSGVSVNRDTGSVMLRAIVPNPAHTLLPGMYVRARLVQGVDVQAILLPQQAVSRNAGGQPTALVVGADDTVRRVTLEIAAAAGDNRWRVISGLQAGERVIVQGREKAEIGEKVAPTAVTFDGDGRAQPVAAGGAPSDRRARAD